MTEPTDVSLTDITMPILGTRADAATADVPAATQFLPGLVLAERYRLGRQLAKGGMGTVHEATQLDLVRRVAIKVLKPGAGEDPARLRRFEVEARMAANLQHPNIAAVHDFGRLPDGAAFIVMELIVGPTLRQHLALDGPLTWRETVRIGEQIAAALDVAHSARVIHGDLSATNVLLQRNSDGMCCKLIDFGVACRAGQRRNAGAAFGTPAYAAPELFAGASPDERSDIFALGAMLKQMLGDTDRALMPPGLRDLLAAMLEASPESRPQTAHEVLRRLHALSLGAPASWRERVPAAVAASAAGLAVIAIAMALVGERLAQATSPLFAHASGNGAAAPRALAPTPLLAGGPRLLASNGAPVALHAATQPLPSAARDDYALARAELLAALDRTLSRRNERAALDRYPVMARREGPAHIAFGPGGGSASVTYRKRFNAAGPGAASTSSQREREYWIRINGAWRPVQQLASS